MVINSFLNEKDHCHRPMNVLPRIDGAYTLNLKFIYSIAHAPKKMVYLFIFLIQNSKLINLF